MVGVLAKKLSISRVYILLLLTAALLLPVGLSLWLGLPAFTIYLIISICFFLMMAVVTMATIQLLTFIQGETPSHLTGKVLSCVMALAMCSHPLGQAMYGFLFETFKATPYLIIFASAIVSGIISLMSKRVFKDIN